MDPVCRGSFDNQQGGWLSPKTIRQEGVRSAITGGNPIRQKKCGRLSQEEIPFGKKTCGRLYGRRSRFGRGDTWQQEKSEAISFKIICISFQILPCNRNLLGFVFRPGYKYTPPAIVKKGINNQSNKPAPCHLSSPLVVSSSSSRGVIDPSTSVSTGNLVIMSSIVRRI